METDEHTAQLAACRERADVATRALFTIRSKLDHAAKQWAGTRDGFSVSQSLAILAEDCNRAWHAAIDGQAVPTVATNQSALTAERNTMLKLIYAMAVNGYRYDPSKDRNEATADIASATDAVSASENVNVNVGTDTVKKYLDLARSTFKG
jgi:hypothetical protein